MADWRWLRRSRQNVWETVDLKYRQTKNLQGNAELAIALLPSEELNNLAETGVKNQCLSTAGAWLVDRFQVYRWTDSRGRLNAMPRQTSTHKHRERKTDRGLTRNTREGTTEKNIGRRGKRSWTTTFSLCMFPGQYVFILFINFCLHLLIFYLQLII